MTEGNGVKCWNCSFENPSGAKFCQNCGQPLERPCPNCGQLNSPDAKFCRNCGFNLTVPAQAASKIRTSTDQPQSSEPETGFDASHERVQKYMPPEVAAKLESARVSRTLEGERRIVTILFCDVKGSTSIAEKMDPEEWAKIMNDGFAYLIEPVYRYEGTVARLLGDAILAFFGAPVAHEDDPQRAVLAGMDIVKGVETYCTQIRRKYGVDYEVRVGLNTGLVVVGKIGTDLKYEYTAMGDAINLASRIQTAADANSVFISESTHRLVAPLFEFEDRGKIEVKGKSEPVQVYKVIEERPEQTRSRGISGLSSPMVGRRRELSTLMQIAREAHSGTGSIVAIIGEAGLGKTRLVAEWRKAALAEISDPPLRWAEGRCLSYGGSIAHHLTASIIRALIGAGPDVSEEDTRAALRKTTENLFSQGWNEVYPYLGNLLGIQLEEDVATALQQVDRSALQAKYIEAYKRFLQAVAEAMPTILVCEDVHWADESSVDLTIQALPVTTKAPLVFVFVTRPEQDTPGWKLIKQAEEESGTGTTRLYLAPLAENDSRKLVGNLLGIDALPESIRHLILAKTEGNPFYVEEVIGMLIDRRGLIRENNHWAATPNLHEIEIPDSLLGVLTARIDRLPEAAKHTLQIASVIGRSFSVNLLGEVLGSEDRAELPTQLKTLETAGLIRLGPRDTEPQYLMRHVLIQDAAYTLLLKQDRKRLHLGVGQALERLHKDRLDSYAALLAQHYEEASDDPKTVEYAIRAGDAAARVYASAEARLHYGKALEALTHLPDSLENRRRRVDTTIKLVSVSALSASPERNLALLTEVEPLAQELANAAGASAEERLRLARVHYWIGRSYYYRGQSREALGYYQKVLAEAQGLGDEELLAIPMSNLGQVMAMVQGQYGKSMPLLARALPQLEKSGDSTEWLRAFTYLALARTARGELAEGLAQIQQALKRSQETTDLTGVGFTQLALANAYTRVNEPQKILAAAKSAVEAAEQSGNLLHSYIAYGAMAWAQGRLGEFEAAAVNFAKSDEIGEKLGTRLVIADQLAAGKAEVALLAGKTDEAITLSESAVALARAVGSVYSEGMAQRTWGEALASLGESEGSLPRWTEAQEHLAASVQALEAAGDLLNAANTYAAWGRLALARGDRSSAREHLAKAAAQYEASGLTDQLDKVRELEKEL